MQAPSTTSSSNTTHSYPDFSALPDAQTLYADLLRQIRSHYADAATSGSTRKLAVVGIHSGGAWLAQRLAKDLLVEELGFVDVSFYRDDYAARGLHPTVKPSQINFSVEGAQILLVDDVLVTGRTTRAALNELFDYGRPACVKLAALLDRGGRELPISADFVAASVTVPAHQSLQLRQSEDGQLSLSLATAPVDHA
ncbi:MAG: bifunctional pyr operon transcriptional regulator/uracil phosphoribosyltransferase PyrR [Burkholderiales bacterium]|nr:bifunctional pyr operon transcriptional regulator/uracil phosphoribosyltransferase PyrR [Burkholderiales bacterium]